MSVQTAPSRATLLDPKDKQRLEDVGFMTCMTLTLLGNYAQTGHFGGPLAYTPYNVAVHLAGPKLGGLRHDYRRPKHPYGDKFMLAAGHCAPTCYALWIIMGEALYRKFKATGDKKYYVAPKDGFLAIDALGFRRGAGALKTLLQDQGLANDPLFAEAREGGRGIHALSGHIESIDQSNDVNGGPSGVGLASAAGKAAFWDMVGAPINQPKVIAFEGEFALCAGHAQELKTQALALKVGKRLRVMFSENNAGIDDSLMGGVIDSKYTGYDFVQQWTSYGWNVMTMANGHDYDQIVGALKAMDDVDPNDRRPIMVIGKTIKGYWPTASNGKIAASTDQVVGYPSHPYAMKMNSDYFVALAKTFEDKYGVEFQGIRNGAVTNTKDRLVQFKTNMDVAMSVLEKNGLGDWLAERIVENGDQVKDDLKLSIDVKSDPFLDERLRVKNLPGDTQTVKVKNPTSGTEKEIKISLFKKAGEVAGRTARDFRSDQVVQLRDRRTRRDDRGGPVRVGEHGAREPVRPLRSREEPRGHAVEGGHSGSRQRVDRHRHRRAERIARSGEVRRHVGVERHVRRVYAADVPAGAGLEPAESGQQVPHGRAAHSGRTLGAGNRRRRTHALRHLRAAGVEALPARPGHPRQLLGLQRRRGGLLRGGRDRRAREEGGHHRD